MYVSVHHTIKDPASFQRRRRRLRDGWPEGPVPLQFLPDGQGQRAVCLWETVSVYALREYVDGCLGDASEQEYFAVGDEYAFGLPVPQTA